MLLFAELFLPKKQPAPSREWPEEAVDYERFSINKLYELAYEAANTENNNMGYIRAANYLIRIPRRESIQLPSSISPLSYEQLYGISRVNPACSSRLLADQRHFAKFLDAEHLIAYLKIAPESTEVLFANDKLMELISSLENLANVLEVAPTALEQVLSKKAKQLITNEQDLLYLAKKIPQLMPKVLKNGCIGRLKTIMGVLQVFAAAPELYPFFKNAYIDGIVGGHSLEHFVIGCRLRMYEKKASGPKALGMMLYNGGYRGIKKDQALGLKYLEAAAPVDQEAANVVSAHYLQAQETMIQTGCYTFDQVFNLHEKIYKETASYRQSLLNIGHIILAACNVSSEDPTYATETEKYAREALPFLIEAYEIKEDEFVINLLDRTLVALYKGEKMLGGGIRLERDTRLAFIHQFKQEWSEDQKPFWQKIFSVFSQASG